MAANTVTLKLKVNDDGSFSIITKEAKKSAKAIDKVTKATDRATSSKNKYNKKEKGVAGLTSNSTKAFSKQAQTLNGGSSSLVGAYATLAANIFAITAAFGALKRAAAFEQLEAGIIRVGNASGMNLPKVAESLRDITGAAISTQEAMTAVALGTSAGFSTEQLEGLTKVAKGASLALGRDMGDAMSRLTRGAAKLEPEILDELGIMVRLDDATEEYAATVGKTAGQLTQFERRMAFTNAIIDQGSKKFGEIAEAIDPNVYDQLSASFLDLSKSGLNLLNKVLKPIVGMLAGNQNALAAGLTLFSTTITKQMVPGLYKGAQAATQSAKSYAELSAKQLSTIASTGDLSDASKKRMVQVAKGVDVEKNLTQVISNQTKSVNSNILGLKNLEKASEQDSVLITRKIGLIRASRAERDATTKALYAQRLAVIKNAEANTIEAASQGNRRLALKLYTQTVNEHIIASNSATATLTLQAKAVNRLGLAYKVASFSLKTFGTALLQALPMISMVAMAVSLLWPLLSGLFEKSAVAKAADEASESFESFAGIVEQLNNTIDNTDSAVTKYISSLKVSVGIIDQVASAIKKVQIAQNSGIQEDLREQFNIVRKSELATKKFHEATANMEKAGRADLVEKSKKVGPTGVLKLARDHQIALEKRKIAEKEINNIMQAREQFSSFEASIVMKNALLELTAAGATTVEIDKTKKSFEDLNNLIGHKVIKTWEQFWEQFNSTTNQSSAKNAIGNIEGIGSAISSFRKASLALTSKSNGPFSGIISSLSEIESGTISAFNKGSKDLNIYAEAVKDTDEKLHNLITKNGKLDFKTGITTAVKDLKDYHKSLKTIKVDLKDYKNKMKDLKKNSTFTIDAMVGYYAEEDNLINRQVNLLKERLALENSYIGNEESILGLKNEINSKEAERTDIYDRNYNILKANFSVETELYKNQIKSLEITKELAKTKSDILNSTLEVSKIEATLAAGPKGLNTKDAANFAAQERALSIQAAELQHTLRFSALEVEFALLDGQTLLLKARIAAEYKGKAVPPEISAYIKALDINNDKQKSLLLLQKTASEANINAMKKASSAAPFLEIFEGLDDVSTSVYDKLKFMSDTLRGALEGEKAVKVEAATKVAVEAKGAPAQEDAFKNLDRAMSLDPASEAVKNFEEQWQGMNLEAKNEHLRIMTSSMVESLKEISPEGELIASVVEGAFAITDAWASVGTAIENGATGLEKGAAIANAAAQTFSAIGSIAAASSSAKIAGIDKEIEAEKARDGKSKDSLAKITALEAKKEKMARKAFETDKKMKMAQAVASTAAAVMQALSSSPPPFSYVMAAISAAMGAAQIAAIAGTSYSGGGSTAATSSPSAISMGERSNTVDLAKSSSQAGELAYLRGDSGVGGIQNFTPAFTGLKHRATGGTTGYMVGEQGPELFIPETPGVIKPADETAAMQQPMQVAFSINTIDSSNMEDMLMNQRGNMIRMFREAANQHGEKFFESVDESSLIG